jgi:hypothetical protein
MNAAHSGSYSRPSVVLRLAIGAKEERVIP